MKNKIKSLFRRAKAVIAAGIVAATATFTTVCASAATAEASDMSSMLTDAGNQITTQFTDLVSTIIPVIIGIMGAGLVIFGIFALIKLAKKIFGKVAG